MKKIVILFAVILLSLFGIRSLYGSSYFPMHDDAQVGRVVSMARALADGQFPVRWVNDLGYGFGYPLFNFYGPLPYYIGAVFYNLGFDALTATKLMMGIGIVLAPILTFLVLEPFFGVVGAAVSAMLFMYAPYHAVQLFVRGAVGELYATAFLPLLFYGCVAPLSGKNNHRTVAIGALGVALIIMSHTILGYVSFMFFGAWIGAYALISFIQKKLSVEKLISYGLQIGIGLCLSAFFWLPAFLEMGYTSVSGQIGATADFRSHFVCASQLMYSQWGFGGSVPGCIDGMSFKLGVIQIVLLFYAVFMYWGNRYKPSIKSSLLIVGVLITLVSLFMLLPVSSFLWDKLPNFSYIQYPWRLLSFVAFGIAVSGGFCFINSASLMRRIFAIVVIVLVLIANYDEFYPQRLIYRPASEYETQEELRLRVSKISDEYLPADVLVARTASFVTKDLVKGEQPIATQSSVEKSHYIKVVVTSTANQSIEIAKAWFPGWRYFVNNVEVPPRIIDGFPNLNVLAGVRVIELRLFDTPVRRFSNVISLVTGFLCIVFYIRYEKNNS